MDTQTTRPIQRGDIYYASDMPAIGVGEGALYPVLVVQNDAGIPYGPTVITAVIKQRSTVRPLATHVWLQRAECGLPQDSAVLLEQLQTLSKDRLIKYVRHVSDEKMREINVALYISVGFMNVDSEQWIHMWEK